MTRPTITIHNAETNVIEVREYNDAELAQHETDLQKREARSVVAAKKEMAKAAAKAKLEALGLTADDLKALGL